MAIGGTLTAPGVLVHVISLIQCRPEHANSLLRLKIGHHLLLQHAEAALANTTGLLCKGLEDKKQHTAEQHCVERWLIRAPSL